MYLFADRNATRATLTMIPIVVFLALTIVFAVAAYACQRTHCALRGHVINKYGGCDRCHSV